MKGLVLSTLYETKKPLITYLIIGIIATVVMTFASPPMSGFIFCIINLFNCR